MTATQANQISVDLAMMDKPVTLFVPHTRTSSGQMNSFSLIAKTIDELANFYEHIKLVTHQRGKEMRMMSPGRKNQHQNAFTFDEIQNLNNSSIIYQDDKVSKKNPSNMHVDYQIQAFSVVDTFYKLKGQIIQNSHHFESLSKNLFAIETKAIQTFFYKEVMLSKVLLEKAEIKKCY